MLTESFCCCCCCTIRLENSEKMVEDLQMECNQLKKKESQLLKSFELQLAETERRYEDDLLKFASIPTIARQRLSSDDSLQELGNEHDREQSECKLDEVGVPYLFPFSFSSVWLFSFLSY